MVIDTIEKMMMEKKYYTSTLFFFLSSIYIITVQYIEYFVHVNVITSEESINQSIDVTKKIISRV